MIGPRLYVTDLPRSTPRPVWYFLYHTVRESERFNHKVLEKVSIDQMLFGSGFYKTTQGGWMIYIEPKDVSIDCEVIQ